LNINYQQSEPDMIIWVKQATFYTLSLNNEEEVHRGTFCHELRHPWIICNCAETVLVNVDFCWTKHFWRNGSRCSNLFYWHKFHNFLRNSFVLITINTYKLYWKLIQLFWHIQIASPYRAGLVLSV
jgi:hypothetical protein